jgi:dipeptidyl aminopeptidase/acylaminoacyl peptidase
MGMKLQRSERMSAFPVRPYGSWKSPITAAQIASSAIGLSEIRLDGETTYWLEMRPTEGGRSVVVRRRPDGIMEDCVPEDCSARTRVHEYGGGSYLAGGGTLYFSNFSDHRVYRLQPDGVPEPLTPAQGLRYADFVWDASRKRLICVREDHTRAGEPQNAIVGLGVEAGGPGTVLASGRDFYAAPRLSPDGNALAWIEWSHPHMPWDAAELWVAPLQENGALGQPRHVAGGKGESALQPLWSPDGILYFAWERGDWWNLHRFAGGRIETLTDLEAEFATPPWVFGMQNYAFVSAAHIVCSFTRHGIWTLAHLDTRMRRLAEIDLPFTDIASIQCGGAQAVFLAGSPSEPLSVIRLELETGRHEVLRRSTTFAVGPKYLSAPEPVEFLSTDGRTAHGLFYPPKNPDFVAPGAERPPLVVMIHGGPTSMASTALRLNIQYYTSRGVAVLDVNYGGSTGYGRAYRERLNGAWGIVDVDDCCVCAAALAAQGRVDGKRLAIRGGSAGGYTTLACLAFRKVFAAGASHYGVSDCELLTQDTHKFESRYLDTLIGPYPERRNLYIARSPLHHLEGLDRPVIFFQGLDDKVVPPNQAEMLYNALRTRKIPTAYVPFDGEQHGFRKAETIVRAIEAEYAFFARIFGFEPADPIPLLPIENL